MQNSVIINYKNGLQNNQKGDEMKPNRILEKLFWIALVAIIIALVFRPVKAQEGIRSGWLYLRAGETLQYPHEIGYLPSSAFVWCAEPLASSITKESKPPNYSVASPWTDTATCRISWTATADNIIVSNVSDVYVWIMITAQP